MSVNILQAGETAPTAIAPAIPAAPAAAAAPTPSETIVRAAQTTGTCKGPTGRSYTFRKLGPLDRMLIAKAVGGDLMNNAVYVSYAFVAASVSSIDVEKMPMATSQKQIEAVVSRIGDDWDALNEAMRFTFVGPETDADNANED